MRLGLIAGGLCYLLPLTSMQTVGLNALLLVGLIYAVQGLGIIMFYFQKSLGASAVSQHRLPLSRDPTPAPAGCRSIRALRSLV